MDISTWLPWVAAIVASVVVVYFIFNFFSGRELDHLSSMSYGRYSNNPAPYALLVLIIPFAIFFLASPIKIKDKPISTASTSTETATVSDTATGEHKGVTPVDVINAIPHVPKNDFMTYQERNHINHMIFMGIFAAIAFGVKFLWKGFSNATAHGNLQVRNLPAETSAEQLKQLFSQSGVVLEVDLVKDTPGSQRPASATIKMAKSDDAQSAMVMFNGQNLNGNRISVNHSR